MSPLDFGSLCFFLRDEVYCSTPRLCSRSALGRSTTNPTDHLSYGYVHYAQYWAEVAAKLSFLCDGVIWMRADGDIDDLAETKLHLVAVLVDCGAYLVLDLMPS